MSLRWGAGLLALAVGLSGCSYLYGEKALIKSREDAYREARETVPPVIPEDLDGSILRDEMAVPEVLGMETYRQLEDYPAAPRLALCARGRAAGADSTL